LLSTVINRVIPSSINLPRFILLTQLLNDGIIEAIGIGL
jgi:hypothetical protein